ncbi:hypothetical protein DVH05_016314 [Phytophthora capsici]|nr:hypothetical protein DVH05_016314 [Phytophthora capsici]
MATTRYRCIRLEGVAEHPSNASDVTSIVTATTDDPVNSEHGNCNAKALGRNVEFGSGEGGYSDNGERSSGGDGGLKAGEGAAIIEPDGEERTLKRRRVTAERRLRRRTARKLARQRRREKITIQKNTQLQKVEKLDRRTIARRAEAENALQALAKRLERRDTPSQETDCREQGEPVQVKLVKQLVERTESTAEGTKDDETFVSSADGLPTARVRVDRVWKDIKQDSCARFTIAGTEWMKYGDRLDVKAPVDCVEGIGGFLLDIVGVWRFRLKTVFGETVYADACIVKGCDDEFLLGVDFLSKHGAKLDFERNDLTYREKERRIIIPSRTDAESGCEGASTKVTAVRIARRTQLTGNAVTPVEVSVAAPDGELGMFVPTRCAGAVMLASTVTRAHNGKALVPMINAAPGRTKLPSNKELGVWIPIDSDMEVLEINGELERDRIKRWLDEIGSQEPLDHEEEVNIGVEDEESRALILKLLQTYRNLVETTGDCPPATALPVEHHIDTGDAAPIMLKRRR